MNVAQLFIKCLESEGVTKIFGVPGEETEDLQFAIEDSKIEFIPCRHEQGAAFIANVWGRLSGNAGVCLATLGPGATNLITGLADAFLDKAPVVAITGQGNLTRMHHESHQMLNIVDMFSHFTKWNAAITTPEVVPEIVRKAFKVAQIEKPGTTHIELSEDVAKMSVPAAATPLAKSNFQRPNPETGLLKKLLSQIHLAERPMILVGNGGVRDKICDSLTEFVSALNIATASTFMGKGVVSDKLPQSLLSLGLGFKDYVMEAVDKSDLIITIGYDIAEYAPDNWNPQGNRNIIHIDYEPAEVYKNYIPQMELIGDIAKILQGLNELNRSIDAQAKNGEWYADVRARIEEDIASYDLSEDDQFNVPGVLNILRENLDDNDILISDVGSHKMWIARNYPTYSSKGCIISNGLASMGISLPGGIAASLLHPNKNIVSVMGDGGFMMNMQELETAKRLGVGYTIVVLNDNDYGLISWKQDRNAGKTAGTKLGNPDFVQLGKSFGIDSFKPNTAGELDELLRKRLPQKEMTLIQVNIKTAVNQELVKKLKKYFA